VIVSIIEDIYIDFNKMAIKMVNIFLSCRSVWLFQRYRIRESSNLTCFYLIKIQSYIF